MLANLPAHPWTRFQSATSGARRTREEGLSTTRELPPSRLDLTGTYDDDGYGALTRQASRTNANPFSTISISWTSHQQATQIHCSVPGHTPGRATSASIPPSPPGGISSTVARFIRRATGGTRRLSRTGSAGVTADFVVEDGIVRGFGFSRIGNREGYGSTEENLTCGSASVCDSGVLGCVKFV